MMPPRMVCRRVRVSDAADGRSCFGFALACLIFVVAAAITGGAFVSPARLCTSSSPIFSVQAGEIVNSTPEKFMGAPIAALAVAMLIAIRSSTKLRPFAQAASLQGAVRIAEHTKLVAVDARKGMRTAMASSGENGEAPKKRVMVPIADGCEAIELVTVVDVLRRAGAEVLITSVEGERKECTCSKGVKIVADVLLSDVAGRAARGARPWDLIAIVGGMPGAERIRDNLKLHSVMQRQFDERRLMAATCAAPAVVFEPKGFLEGYAATAHPAFADELGGSLEEKTMYRPARVIVDGHIITSQGPGTAVEFSLCLVEKMYGSEAAASVAERVCTPPYNARPPVPFEWRMKHLETQAPDEVQSPSLA